MFHRNAAGVFESIQGPKPKTWDPGFYRQRMNAHAIRIEVDPTALADHGLPDEIEALAFNVKTFMEAMISDFPVFKDDAVHLALETFESQLEVTNLLLLGVLTVADNITTVLGAVCAGSVGGAIRRESGSNLCARPILGVGDSHG